MNTQASAELQWAVTEGDLARIKVLEAKYFDLGAFQNICAVIRAELGMNVLHLAASKGKTIICRYMIEKMSLDVNYKTAEGDTTLILAIRGQHMETANYLIEYGANIREQGSMGMSPLHCAIAFEFEAVIQLLISKGADVEAISQFGTPLQLATMKGNKKAVGILLLNSANPTSAPYVFWPPIFIALSGHLSSNAYECLDLLLKAGALPNTVLFGTAPIHQAASNFEAEYIRLLLDAGASPNMLDQYGMAPLELAALANNREAVMILFPLTIRIHSYPDWSVGGIISYMFSQQATKKRNLQVKNSLGFRMESGTVAYENKHYTNAMFHFYEAIRLNPSDATVRLNRSLCFARLQMYDLALSDALACCKLQPNWALPPYRVGVTHMLLKDPAAAFAAFTQAMRLDPTNQVILKAFLDSKEINEKCKAYRDL